MSALAQRRPHAETGRLSLDRDGRDWPNRHASRFVEANGMRWHVQRMGHGPRLLLLHGTGASTHSWREMLPLLARRFDVVAPDLPGHGFTDPAPARDMGLTGMSAGVAAFLRAIDFSPDIVVGHSAGAAVLARMTLDGMIAPRLIVSLNGAFMPFEGLAGKVFPAIAKLLLVNPFAARFFSWTADENSVARLLRGTGSRIDRKGIELYRRLFSNTAHVSNVLAMMGNWNIGQLADDMMRLSTPLELVVADEDRAVPPAAALKLVARLPHATIRRLPGVGHLAHEEKPKLVADMIIQLARALEPPLAGLEADATPISPTILPTGLDADA